MVEGAIERLLVLLQVALERLGPESDAAVFVRLEIVRIEHLKIQ
jgi:hypothetical protein